MSHATSDATSDAITVGTALTPGDFGPVVVLASGGEKRLVLSCDEARSFALSLMDAAARAEAESLLARWLEVVPGMNDAKREAAFADFRRLYSGGLYKGVRKAHGERVKSDQTEGAGW